jgi:hypothetical protein
MMTAVLAIDFSVLDIYTEPASPGEGLQMKVVVKYSLDQYASGFKNEVLFDGTVIAAPVSYGTTAGTQYASGYVTPSSSGLHTIKGRLDADSAYSETSEDNNVIQKEVYVTASPEPDLTVKSYNIWASVTAPKENQPIELGYTVSNIGAADSGSFTCQAYDNGNLIDTYAVGGLSAGEESSRRIAASFGAGSHTIQVNVDTAGTVTESDENNNIQSRTWNVQDACGGITCADYCSDTSTLKTGGSCSLGACQYQTVACQYGCSNSRCVSKQADVDPCAGVTCNNYCSGSSLYYGGSCSAGSCVYAVKTCEHGCSNSACNAQPKPSAESLKPAIFVSLLESHGQPTAYYIEPVPDSAQNPARYAFEYWYYWPHEGKTGGADWEPVIIITDADGTPTQVFTMAHDTWVLQPPVANAAGRIEVYFTTDYHAPSISWQNTFLSRAFSPGTSTLGEIEFPAFGNSAYALNAMQSLPGMTARQIEGLNDPFGISGSYSDDYKKELFVGEVIDDKIESARLKGTMETIKDENGNDIALMAVAAQDGNAAEYAIKMPSTLRDETVSKFYDFYMKPDLITVVDWEGHPVQGATVYRQLTPEERSISCEAITLSVEGGKVLVDAYFFSKAKIASKAVFESNKAANVLLVSLKTENGYAVFRSVTGGITKALEIYDKYALPITTVDNADCTQAYLEECTTNEYGQCHVYIPLRTSTSEIVEIISTAHYYMKPLEKILDILPSVFDVLPSKDTPDEDPLDLEYQKYFDREQLQIYAEYKTTGSGKHALIAGGMTLRLLPPTDEGPVISAPAGGGGDWGDAWEGGGGSPGEVKVTGEVIWGQGAARIGSDIIALIERQMGL